jgi:hypothetical protein
MNEPKCQATATTLVIVPTYNERDNTPPFVGALLGVSTDLDILTVDDASPDGTGVIADEIAKRNGRVRVLHRAGKQGLGAAYLAGFVSRSMTRMSTSSRRTLTSRIAPRTCRDRSRPCTPRTW